jgi:hypothetical protein
MFISLPSFGHHIAPRHYTIGHIPVLVGSPGSPTLGATFRGSAGDTVHPMLAAKTWQKNHADAAVSKHV